MSIAKVYEDRQKCSEWIKSADRLMISASLSWDALDSVLWGPRKIGPTDYVVAYLNGFLLLSAFAFENLYRGWLVAVGRGWREVRGKGSHHLVKQLSEVMSLSAEELRLVERLEAYLLWAGRYTVPWDVKTFADASSRFLEGGQGSDYGVAKALFSRIRALILTHCQSG